jgi:cation:H+ antiporter
MESLSTTWLVVVLLAGAVVTWVAGVSLAKATDVIDDRYDLGQALGGTILLGIAGTLPELAITVSAALSGHLALATGNLLGGIAMQTLVLVILDATSRRRQPLSPCPTRWSRSTRAHSWSASWASRSWAPSSPPPPRSAP